MLRVVLYQTFRPPVRLARDMSFTTDLRMIDSFLGTDGTSESITPLGVISRGLRRIREDLHRIYALSAVSPLVMYVGALATAAVGFAAVVTIGGVGVGPLWAVLCLSGVAALAERGSVRLTATAEVSISLVPTLLAAVLFGPLAAMVVAAASMLPDLAVRGERRYLRWATYTATRSITAGCAGLAAISIQGTGSSSGITALVIATVVAALMAELLDVGFGALTGRVRGGVNTRDLLATFAPLAFASVALYAPVIAVVAIAYREVSPVTLPLFLVPALAAQRLHAMYQNQRTLTSDLLTAYGTLEKANLSFATALVATLEARDQYTAGHSAAVAVYARDIAERMNLPADQQQLARVTGLVHDIGKIGLTATLLEKAGPLNLAERREMETHAEIGERILLNVEDYADVAKFVRHHHERVDGMGYPDGLKGEETPLISRIIGVADAYNAMTSDRPYRDAMPSSVARLRLAQAVGSQFDVAVVAAFEAILAQAPEAYRLGQSPGFALKDRESLSTPLVPERVPGGSLVAAAIA